MKLLSFVLLLTGFESVFGIHASCNMTLTVHSAKANQLNNALIKMVQSRTGFNSTTCIYADQGNEFCGYAVVATSSGFDHFQHTTPLIIILLFGNYIDTHIGIHVYTQGSSLYG